MDDLSVKNSNTKIKRELISILTFNKSTEEEFNTDREKEIDEIDIDESPIEELLQITIDFILGFRLKSKEFYEAYIKNYLKVLQIDSCLIDSVSLRTGEADSSLGSIKYNSHIPAILINNNKTDNHNLNLSDSKIFTIPVKDSNFDFNCNFIEGNGLAENHPVSIRNLINKEEDNVNLNYLKLYLDSKANIVRREDKIMMNQKIKKLDINFPKWEEREYIKDLLEVLYFKSLNELKLMIAEEKIRETRPEGSKSKPSFFTLMPCGHLNPGVTRKDLLRRRITPDMTMEEYVKVVMADLKTREEAKSDRTKVDINSRDEKIKKDERRDKEQNFRGNVKNMG